MKKVPLTLVTPILGLLITSCTNIEQRLPEETTRINAPCDVQPLIQSAQNLLYDGSAEAIADFSSYLQKNAGGISKKTAVRGAIEETTLLNFAKLKGVTVEKLDSIAVVDPQIALEYIKFSTSEDFYSAVVRLLSTSEKDYSDVLYEYIACGNFSNEEIAFLAVLSVPDSSAHLRASAGCLAKRYWKLTKIAAGSIAVSFIEGVDAGVRHATTELQEMKDSGNYEC